MQKINSKNTLFPNKLKQIYQPPKELFVMGEIKDLFNKPTLAVVGSRKASPYGRLVTEKLVKAVASRGVAIVSGLAIGIDSIAHQAAIDSGGQTIAVLPCGLDEVYPRSHLSLAKSIIKSGGLVISEYPPHTQAFKQHFIARNRLIAGLSDAILLTEAAIKSGSLHTANFGLEAGKDIFAVPGSINSPTSEGCNNLIKNGAGVITNSDDLLNYFHISVNNSSFSSIHNASNPDELKIIQLISDGIIDNDEIYHKSKLTTIDFQQTITMLEITGIISPIGGGKWTLLN